MTTLPFVLFIGYLIGSVPSGYLIARFLKGIDIREYGSGNIGFANTLRVLGLFPGLAVLVADIAKGAVSVGAGILFASFIGISPQIAGGTLGLSSIIGHNWSVFLKFRGGKGVATTAGVFLVLTPFPFMFSALAMALVMGLTRYVSLGSMIAGGSLPLFIWLWVNEKDWFYLFLSVAAASLIVFTHRSNLGRLLQGKERKLGERI
ncbi:MAG: glycerol-3-phosphate 1-O-acyltransferase PlsY [bacterium]